MSYKHIYKEYFVPWMKKEHADVFEDKYPKMETFRQARHDDNFADVLKRPKHRHCRCSVCAMLTARGKKYLRDGFRDEREKAMFEQERQQHELDKFGWRKEVSIQQERAHQDPDI